MSLLNYYLHPESDSIILSASHPGDTCEEIGPAALPLSVEDFRLTWCIATLTPPPKHLMESAAYAIHNMDTFIQMRSR